MIECLNGMMMRPMFAGILDELFGRLGGLGRGAALMQFKSNMETLMVIIMAVGVVMASISFLVGYWESREGGGGKMGWTTITGILIGACGFLGKLSFSLWGAAEL